jgi:hypothetical protein
MKILKMLVKAEDVKKYTESNDNEFSLDKDIQDIVAKEILIKDVKSYTGYNLVQCYYIEYTIEDINKEQIERIIESIEKLIEIRRFIIVENGVEKYDRTRVK